MSMSIIKRKVLLKSIEITISDEGNYYDVALFLDREETLKELYELRRKWINYKLIDNDNIVNYINQDRNSVEAKTFWDYYLKVFATVKRLGYGMTYVSPFLAAVLSGVVTDKDYSTVIKEHLIDNIPEDYRFDYPVVYSSSRIRKPDLMKITHKDTKAIHNIELHRQLYWEYASSGPETGYRTLAKKYLGDNNLWQTVKSAIVSYDRKLTLPPMK